LIRLLDVEVNVLEGGVVGALFLELEVIVDGEKDDVAELKVGRELSMAVVLRVVVVLQSEGGLIVLRVLGLCVKVELEVEHEGVEERRVEASGAVQGRDEGEELLQHREDERELVGFLFAFKGDVAEDSLFGFGALGQLLVLGLQLAEVSDFVCDCGEAVYGHFGFFVGVSAAASVLSGYGRALASAGAARRALSRRSGRYRAGWRAYKQVGVIGFSWGVGGIFWNGNSGFGIGSCRSGLL
jgi:hypothetical protein